MYAKLAGEPSDSVHFFEVIDAGERSCRFLVQHKLSGDLVRVFQKDGLGCALNWTQIPSAEGITTATLLVPSPPPPSPPSPPAPSGGGGGGHGLILGLSAQTVYAVGACVGVIGVCPVEARGVASAAVGRAASATM